MKDHLRYEVYSDEEQREIDYCSNKQDAMFIMKMKIVSIIALLT